MFQKALDLYFLTIVVIFREGSTKVPQILLDQIFVDFGVLYSNCIKFINHRLAEILKNIEN